MSKKGTTKLKPNWVSSTGLRAWIFRKCCVFPESSMILLSTILLCSASSALAHTGFTVVAPFSKTPPIFNAAPRSPRGSRHGCDTPTAYGGANFLQIDGTVSVFVVYTDTDVFFCFSGVNRREPSAAALPDPGTSVGA